MWPLLLALALPWPGEHGIVVETPGLDWRQGRPRASAIVYRPDGSSFVMRRRAVRSSPLLATIRFPEQPPGTRIYVTVEQGAQGWGMPLDVP